MSGAACVQPALAADNAGREHAQALCTLLAQALWRLQLTSSMHAAQGEAQRQQVQSTFLAAISHDLRTPLAAVVGAASSLQTQRDPTRRIKSSVPEGLSLIKADPVLLAQLIGNLLDNALKYSRDAIELAVSATGNELLVS